MYRTEHDSMGEVRVPADRLWGAQTQRSHENFPIGVGIETMPAEIIHAFGILKKAAARANHALVPDRMTEEKLVHLCWMLILNSEICIQRMTEIQKLSIFRMQLLHSVHLLLHQRL